MFDAICIEDSYFFLVPNREFWINWDSYINSKNDESKEGEEKNDLSDLCDS